ncbi:hypothetical protein GCM10009841_02040 [Microlunatus panaciterrae]
MPILAALVISVVGYAHARPATGSQQVAAPSVMVVGDSISQGSAGDWTWRYRFATQLAADGTQVSMVGPRNYLYDHIHREQGDTHYADAHFDRDHDATWGRRLEDEATTIRGEVRTAQPDYLLLLMGINDMMSGHRSAAQTEQSLRSSIAEARAGRPTVKFVLGTLPPNTRNAEVPAIAARRVEYNERLRVVAKELTTGRSPIRVADVATGIDPRTDLWDGLHPNARGEVKIAAAFVDAMAGYGVGHRYPRPLVLPAIGPTQPPRLSVVSAVGVVRFSWTVTPGATGYRLWVRDLTAGETSFRPLGNLIGVKQNTWVVTALADGAEYEFKLQPVKGTAAGVASNVVVGTPLPAPDRPQTYASAQPHYGVPLASLA